MEPDQNEQSLGDIVKQNIYQNSHKMKYQSSDQRALNNNKFDNNNHHRRDNYSNKQNWKNHQRNVRQNSNDEKMRDNNQNEGKLLNVSKRIQKQDYHQREDKQVQSQQYVRIIFRPKQNNEIHNKIRKYMKDMKQFREDFSTICQKSVHINIGNNIWNQWIVTVLGLQKSVLHLIPDKASVTLASDKTLEHFDKKLEEKGQDPKLTYQEISDRINLLFEEHNQFLLTHLSDNQILQELSDCTSIDKNYNYDIDIVVKVLKINYLKLEGLFLRHTGKERESILKYLIFQQIFNYNYIGKGYQWCIPPPLMQFLKQNYDVKSELFASPLNHCNENYYCLFESDKLFGGRGNCLQIEDLPEGGYEANPPFIEKIMEINAENIIKQFKLKKEYGKQMFLIYILPWKDSKTYETLTSIEEFNIDTIKLNRLEHHYFCIDTLTYEKASFDTFLVLLGTSDYKNKYTPQIKNQIIKIFTNGSLNL